jgi:hypothetical protein
MILLVQNLWWIRRTVGTIPLPRGLARSSALFLTLFLMAFVAKNVVTPLVLGSVCLAIVVVYVHSSGMIDQFHAAWQATPEITD